MGFVMLCRELRNTITEECLVNNHSVKEKMTSKEAAKKYKVVGKAKRAKDLDERDVVTNRGKIAKIRQLIEVRLEDGSYIQYEPNNLVDTAICNRTKVQELMPHTMSVKGFGQVVSILTPQNDIHNYVVSFYKDDKVSTYIFPKDMELTIET